MNAPASTATGTIMIIDDEPDNLNVLGDMLRQAGWGVRAFARGAPALAAARAERPDLVLLDIRMPDMNGYEVCRRFKAEDDLRAVPIIFLSAFAEVADKMQAFEAGGVDYVTKPFAAAEVLARTRTHLRLRQHQVQLEALVQQRVVELAAAHRRLRIWDDAKTQWLNMLAHEMRTPLGGVFGIAELLFMDLPPASEHHDLRQAYDLSRTRIEKLMDDALTLAHIDVAGERFAASPVRLLPVLRSALDTLPRLGPAHTVRAALAAVEEVTVLGDQPLLSRAFSDLLLTATHCMAEGAVLTLEAHVAAGQAHVMLCTGGASLGPEALATFFDVGGQRTLLKGGGDFGLGAALGSRIIRLFHGRVSVCNAPEQGLLLEISLPTTSRAPLTGGHD